MATGYYLGVDVGSVSTNLVVIDENGYIMKKSTCGQRENPSFPYRRAWTNWGATLKTTRSWGGGHRLRPETHWQSNRGRSG